MKLVVDASTSTPASGTAVNHAGMLVAGWLNANNSGKETVCTEWDVPKGDTNMALCAMESGEVLAEGSLPIARYLTERLASAIEPAADAHEAAYWLDFALTRLTGDFGRLTSALGELNDRLRFRTWLLHGTEPSCIDFIAWAQLRTSPVFMRLSKTPGQVASEVARWFRFVGSNAVTTGCMEALAEASKTRRERQRDQASFAIDLAGAEMGKVVTRFPPEPSGYLHIGHAKAVLLNQYFAQAYKGQLIVRFDDTNPSKEKCEFEEAILEDLALLGVQADRMSHTSDYFGRLEELCEQMLREGTAYADDTPQEKMRDERFNGIESVCRSQDAAENLRRWEEMRAGSVEGLRNCIRAKIDMKATNKALRDPVMYRCNATTPHHRTGTTYRVYPTYDFACPIVDSIEGVTHALRTNEYHDRNDQYLWFLRTLKMRSVAIWDYSRLNFVYTLLSKRKLAWFVDTGRVTGWDDPRFPTVRGIRRRGLTVSALRDYILMQGPSKNTLLLEWDKLWALNKKAIDSVAARYTALSAVHLCRATLLADAPGVPASPELRTAPLHRKNLALGTKEVAYSDHFFLEQTDAVQLVPGVEFTLMDWGNAVVVSVERASPDVVVSVVLRLNLAGDFKTTALKATWLSPDPRPLLPLALHDYDYLITKKKLEEEDSLDDCLTPVTEFVTPAIGDANMGVLRVGDIIQIERKGFFIVDAVPALPTTSKPIRLIAIPDGKTKSTASKHN
jgi:glutamyl-tRNA synthetase